MNRVSQVDQHVKINRALVSVYDKSDLSVLVTGLLELNPQIEIISSGGTFRRIQELLPQDFAGMLVPVEEYTGQPEMQGGLVKTLDFKIYTALLSETYNEQHQNDLARLNTGAIDLVVVNLYPFEQATGSSDATLEDARANIDIGGPCMIRASAKNFLRVSVLTDPAQYRGFVETCKTQQSCTSLQQRYHLARAAFSRTAAYDGFIAEYLSAAELASAQYEIQ